MLLNFKITASGIEGFIATGCSAEAMYAVEHFGC
jgi:hypothetical protein